MAAAMRQAESFLRHGGRLDAARGAWPEAPTPWIDLSTGINPLPWAPPAELRYDPAPLPEPAALARLEAAAAARFGVAPSRVAAVPGSEIALRLLPMLGCPLPIGTAEFGYATHREIAGEGEARTLLIANPNNPDGRLRSAAELRDLLSNRQALGGWLVIDEAFAETVGDASILAQVPEEAPAIALRSFGKFFGWAGVRLGFVIAPPAILARLRGLLGDWPVTAQAIAWGIAAYADTRWIAATRDDLARRANDLDALLARHGLTARGACPLFRLVEHADAAILFERLARAGILTRPFAERPTWLRFGLPRDAAATERLDRALGGG